MIQTEDILSLAFYKKEKFTGSYKGMRYLIEKTKDEEETDVFCAYTWPGPYNFATTDDALKQKKLFPFTNEGKQQVVDWLNEQWNAGNRT